MSRKVTSLDSSRSSASSGMNFSRARWKNCFMISFQFSSFFLCSEMVFSLLIYMRIFVD